MKVLIPFLLLLCCISTCFSSPVSISDDIFTSQPSLGRNLLQSKKTCLVNFEVMNYTIITSRCKAPQYPLNPCCDAFKEFVCPYRDALNDLTNDCSTKMFDNIYSHGNYTRGLFSTCQDDKIGLICPASPPSAGNNVGADSNISPDIHSSSLLTLIVAFLVLFMSI